MKAVELKNLSFAYEGAEIKVLNNVNFSLEYGEVALLSGLSSEGKSTLLSVIAGIILNVISGIVEGEVLIDGQQIAGKKMSEICRKVGVVLQNADSQIIQKRVEDEVAFGCENFAFPTDKISTQINIVCKMMNIDPDWQTRTLSGGQKQRLITASTLATGQKILILDEPLANLDCDGADFLMNTLRKLAGAGYAVLVVEHRLDMVMRCVDSVWNVRAGVVTKIENKYEYLRSQTVVIDDSAKKHAEKEPLFAVKNVAYSIKNRHILRDVSFTVNKGERLLLLGENGCGKTTLLRIIGRLIKPSDGEILQFMDKKLGKRAGGKWFKKVGVVYQIPTISCLCPRSKESAGFPLPQWLREIPKCCF